MPIDPVNPLGWGPKDPVTSAQLNGLDQRLVRAVDGVQGGAYAGPLSLSNTQLVGTSGFNATGNVVTKGQVQAGQIVLAATTLTNLADGSSNIINFFGGSIFHLSTAAALGGAVRITLTWAPVVANALYVVTLDHSNIPLGQVVLTWSGTGMTHRFSGGVAVDGQPTQGPNRDMWTGVALSTTEIYWTITRGLV